MAEGLKLVIGADVKQAEQALKELSADFNKTGEAAENLGNKVQTKLNKPLSNTLPAAVTKASTALKRLPATSNAATQSLINLGRVAQDAPFGFLGIANNLNPLLESFQRLKATTGTTGGALRALGSSLLGAGGLGFALSIVSSLLIVFGDKIFGAGKKAKETEEKLETLAEKNKKIKDTFDSASKAVVAQADKLTDLKNVLTSVTNEYLILTDAVVKQGLAQFLFTQKEGLVQQQLSAAIQTNLKVQKTMLAFRESEFKVAEKTANLTPLRLAGEAELKQAGLLLAPVEQQIFDINKLAASLGLNFDQFIKPEKATKDKKTLDDYVSKAKQLAAELTKIGFVQPEFSFFDSLPEQLEKAKEIFADFNSRNLKLNKDFFKIDPTFSEPRPEQLKEALNQVEQGIKSGVIALPPIPLEVTISDNLAGNVGVIKEFKKAFQDIGRAMPEIDMELPAGFNFNVLLDDLRKFFGAAQNVTKEGLQAMAANFERGVENINRSISSLQVDALAGLGEAIGTALAKGDISGVFQGFANTLAGAVQAIGKQFIALGTIAVAAKESLKALFANPFATIAVGVALVAVGAALKAVMSKGVTGFAAGGLVSGPVLGLVGEGVGTSRSNPEVIAPLDKLKAMLGDLGGTGAQRVYVTGRLRGSDMVLQNARTGRSQRRLGA